VIHFTLLEPQRVQQIATLERQAGPHPWTQQMLRSSLSANADGHLICDEQQTIGYLLVQSVLDEAELLNIVIFKPFQGKGYGRSAIEQLKKDLSAVAVKKIFLEVRCSNAAARALYKSAGFELLATRKGYYRPRGAGSCAEDALVMACYLQSPM